MQNVCRELFLNIVLKKARRGSKSDVSVRKLIVCLFGTRVFS